MGVAIFEFQGNTQDKNGRLEKNGSQDPPALYWIPRYIAFTVYTYII